MLSFVTACNPSNVPGVRCEQEGDEMLNPAQVRLYKSVVVRANFGNKKDTPQKGTPFLHRKIVFYKQEVVKFTKRICKFTKGKIAIYKRRFVNASKKLFLGRRCHHWAQLFARSQKMVIPRPRSPFYDQKSVVASMSRCAMPQSCR